jgi:hypothetical protein
VSAAFVARAAEVALMFDHASLARQLLQLAMHLPLGRPHPGGPGAAARSPS